MAWVVEKRSGQAFDEYVVQNIMQPLGINITSVSVPTPEVVEQMALPYVLENNTAVPAQQVRYSGYPAGDVYQRASLDTLQRRIILTPFDEPTSTLVAGETIPIVRADIPYLSDVAALVPPPNGIPSALSLAERPAEIGDTVWLYARLWGSSAPQGLLHPATVVADSFGLVYVFHEDFARVDNTGTEALLHTSGGPVLNSRGEVTALNTRSGTVREVRAVHPECCSGWPDQQPCGWGIPADTVRAFIGDVERQRQ